MTAMSQNRDDFLRKTLKFSPDNNGVLRFKVPHGTNADVEKQQIIDQALAAGIQLDCQPIDGEGGYFLWPLAA